MRNIILLFAILFSIQSFSQKSISGKVMDKLTKETLIASHCRELNSGKATVTNEQGYFNLRCSEGDVRLNFQYVGYELLHIDFVLQSDTIVNIELSPKIEHIEEVNIIAEVPLHEQTLLGKNILKVDAIKTGPSSFGEPDLMKVVTTLPGISPGKEGRSSFYVRGGDRGQNLILFDGTKLYNTSHLGGFVSLFNTDVVKQVDVYKGGFPSRFGGRSSSVIDIHSRDGNRTENKGKFNIGVLSSSVLYEGPIGSKASFLIAGRTSYFDLFTLPARRKLNKFGAGSVFSFRFFDINAKLTYYINSRNKFFINVFKANDYYENKSRYPGDQMVDMLYDIRNDCFTVGSYTSIGKTVFWKNSCTYSNYQTELGRKLTNELNGNKSIENYGSNSGISELNFQSKFEFYPTLKHTIKAGTELSLYQFNPGVSRSFESNSNTGFELDTTLGYSFNLKTNELNFFVEDELQLSSKLFVNFGLREVIYRSGIKTYFRTEPRMSFRAMINDNLSFKANYTIMNQFNHVAISNYIIFEKELWMASTDKIPPQQAKQYSLGLFSTIPKLHLQFSSEFYYKTMTNLLEYKIPTSIDFVISDVNEMVITGGKGEAYGAELQAKYKHKSINAELAYVLAWNNRKFDDLNNGNPYPFIYDRRHEFTFLFSKIFKHGYSFSSNFTFSTGTPYTLPNGYVKENKFMYPYYSYSGINNKRLPNYHRLDMTLTKTSKTKKGRINTFKFNVFNAYAKQNPVIIYYDSNTGKVYKKSMFSIIPTVSYSLEF